MLGRAGDQLSTLVDVFREPQLRRLELSWAGYYIGEWAHFVAVSIYAFSVGGAGAVGLLGLVRMAPAAVALPIGGMLSDRYPRQRVLFAMYLLRAGTIGAIALALAADSPRAVVFALAALAAVVGAPVRPATLALVPMLARTPQELVAANVSSSTLEGVGTLRGPGRRRRARRPVRRRRRGRRGGRRLRRVRRARQRHPPRGRRHTRAAGRRAQHASASCSAASARCARSRTLA